MKNQELLTNQSQNNKPPAVTFVVSAATTDPGKTTTAKHGLAPYLSKFFSRVSHIGFDDPSKPRDGEDMIVQRRDMQELIEKLILPTADEAFILDVGGEEFASLLPLMSSDIQGVVDIGRVVVVVSPQSKTGNVYLGIKKLIEQGVDRDSIRVVWNRIPQSDIDLANNDWTIYREAAFKDFLVAMRSAEPKFRLSENQLCPVPLINAPIIAAHRTKKVTIQKLAEKSPQELKDEAYALREAGKMEEYDVVRNRIVPAKHASNVVGSWNEMAAWVYS